MVYCRSHAPFSLTYYRRSLKVAIRKTDGVNDESGTHNSKARADNDIARARRPTGAKMKRAAATAVRCTDNEVRGTPERNLRPFVALSRHERERGIEESMEGEIERIEEGKEGVRECLL